MLEACGPYLVRRKAATVTVQSAILLIAQRDQMLNALFQRLAESDHHPYPRVVEAGLHG